MKNKFLLISIIIILVILNFAIYGKTMFYDYVRFDDNKYIISNPLIRRLDSETIKKIFTEFYFANYQPLVLLTYAVEYKYFKTAPAIYHMTNSVLHVINSILVFFLIYLITKKDVWVSFIIALLFSVHPIQAESVAWIAERKGLLCALFYFPAFMAYIRFSRKGGRFFYILSIFLFLCSLLSKPMSLTFPIILLIFDYYEENLTKSKILEKLPFLLLSAIFFVVTYLSQKGGKISVGEQIFVSNFLFAFYTVAFYIGKLIIPIRLAIHYPYPKGGVFSKEILIAILVIITLILYLVNIKRIRRDFSFGLLFFLISLIPVLRLVPVGNVFAANRYMYMPMVGFFFAIVMPLKSISLNCRLVFKRLLAIVTMIYILNLGILANKECKVWRNALTLWSNTLKFYPNYWNGLLNIGYFYIEVQDTKKALQYLLPALNDKDGREIALLNVGMAYFYDDKLEDAKKYFLALIKEYPQNEYQNNQFAYMYLGDISCIKNDFEEGFKYYEDSLKIDTENPKTLYHYGISLEKQGNTTQAIQRYKLAYQFDMDWELPQKALKRLRVLP